MATGSFISQVTDNYLTMYLLSMKPWRLRPEKFETSAAVPPAPVRVPSQRPLAPSVESVTSVANVKGDNEMILGAVHRSPGNEIMCFRCIYCII